MTKIMVSLRVLMTVCGLASVVCPTLGATRDTHTNSVVDLSRTKGVREMAMSLSSTDVFDLRGDFSFRRECMMILGDRLRGKSEQENRQTVSDLLGVALYSSLETRLLGFLESRDPEVQAASVRTLGTLLHSAKARTKLRSLVFHQDRSVQIRAIEALLCLDEPGSKMLVEYGLLSGRLHDATSASVFTTLSMKDVDLGCQVGAILCKNRAGPMTVKFALPAISKAPDYLDIARGLLLSGSYELPPRNDLTISQTASLNLLCDLMWIVIENAEKFRSDDLVRQRIRSYGNDAIHEALYRRALLALERLGEDRGHFIELLKKDGVPEQKRKLLSGIIERMERGKKE